MNVTEALRLAAARLAATSDSARLDAELLMAHALGVTRSELLLRHLQDEVPSAFAQLVDRRARHEPVAYLTGSQEFFGRSFAVAPAVLIPRADSETIVQAALDACPAPARVLDCGVGSGALLLTVLAECRRACGIGIDRSDAALAIAVRNAECLGLAERAEMRRLDWNAPGWSQDLGHFDLVLANPPYVETGAALDADVREWEPAEALFAGADGLDDYRVLIPALARLLMPGGTAVLEIGAAQADAVMRLTQLQGLDPMLRKDLAGRPRAVVLQFALGK